MKPTLRCHDGAGEIPVSSPMRLQGSFYILMELSLSYQKVVYNLFLSNLGSKIPERVHNAIPQASNKLLDVHMSASQMSPEHE